MGQFSNVELSDEITDIPQNIAINPNAVALIYNMMVLQMEAAYINYLAVYKENPVMVKAFPQIIDFFKEIQVAVENEKTKTFDQLVEELNKESNKE